MRERLFARSVSLTPNVVVLVEVGVAVKVDMNIDEEVGEVLAACRDVLVCVVLLQGVPTSTTPDVQCPAGNDPAATTPMQWQMQKQGGRSKGLVFQWWMDDSNWFELNSSRLAWRMRRQQQQAGSNNTVEITVDNHVMT